MRVKKTALCLLVMIALSENQIENIEAELKKNIAEIDHEICEAEQAMRAQITELKKSVDLPVLGSLEDSLSAYGKGVRVLRANLTELEKTAHALVEPIPVIYAEREVKEKIADQIQKETHDAPATFRDFVKGLLMWRDAPEDRMSE